MAEKRMLARAVSQSRKVNSLSLKAALVYTWAIPWFDSFGFILAETDYLKLNIVPRRNDITEDDLSGILQELSGANLWKLSIDQKTGKLIAYDPKFKDFQDLREDRLGKSKFTPGASWQLPEPPAEDKIKEVKIREDKKSINTENDNGCHLKPETQKAISELLIKYPRFPITKVIQMALSLKKHPDAILYAIQETTKDCKGFNPEQYFNTILERTSGNYYESEAVKKHEEVKKGMPNSIKSILKEALK